MKIIKSELKKLKAIKEEIVYSSTFEMKEGDRLIFFSDGVAQSGIALGPSNKEREDDPAYAVFRSQRRIVQSLPSVVKATGWGTDNVSDFIQKKLVNNPDISSRQLARAIVTEANKNDKYTATAFFCFINRRQSSKSISNPPREINKCH